MIILDQKKCNGCHACMAICPQNCIKMECNEEGFLYPRIQEHKCIHCNLCEKVCPVLKTCSTMQNEILIAYSAVNTNELIRLNSSSGGIFSLLAENVIEQGGVVFGAIFDEKFNVIHSYTEKIEELPKFQGSKYVQSKIGQAYIEAEKFLKAGRYVLFTGTPCQIEGLKAYLRKDYENLFTQDLICHGVPSPLVWEKYLDYRKVQANGLPPKKIAFRRKDEGWKRFSVAFQYENATEYRQTLDKDPMMQVFLKDLCLRESCYECAFKSKNRNSDITLADFWGIQKVLPEMDDDKGTSLIIIHSQKGKMFFENIVHNLRYKEIDIEQAIFHNPAMIKSANKPKKREMFMQDIKHGDFACVQEKYCKETLRVKIRKALSKIKHKLLRR